MNIAGKLEDTAAVRAVMQLYIDGAGGDMDKLHTAFHADARMFGHVGDKRRDMPISQFIEGVGKAPGPLIGPRYRADLANVNVTGRAAVVTLIEQDYRGCDFINYFTLAKFDTGWKIVSKTFTSTGDFK